MQLLHFKPDIEAEFEMIKTVNLHLSENIKEGNKNE